MIINKIQTSLDHLSRVEAKGRIFIQKYQYNFQYPKTSQHKKLLVQECFTVKQLHKKKLQFQNIQPETVRNKIIFPFRRI